MGKRLTATWASTKSAAAALGCSSDHLFNLRNDGLLKLGKHCRDIRRPGAARGTYRWHLARCAQVLDSVNYDQVRLSKKEL